MQGIVYLRAPVEDALDALCLFAQALHFDAFASIQDMIHLRVQMTHPSNDCSTGEGTDIIQMHHIFHSRYLLKQFGIFFLLLGTQLRVRHRRNHADHSERK